MENMTPARHDVIMAGIGGKGVLIAGQLLAGAGMQSYKHVSWAPTYFAIMRGGSCECTIILSQEEIASRILNRAEAVVVFEPTQLQDFEGRAKPNGLLIAESADLPEIKRQDIKVVKVPAIEMAAQLGGILAANFVLLGAYTEITKVVSTELIEKEIEQRFSTNEKALSLNRRAFQEGILFATKQ